VRAWFYGLERDRERLATPSAPGRSCPVELQGAACLDPPLVLVEASSRQNARRSEISSGSVVIGAAGSPSGTGRARESIRLVMGVEGLLGRVSILHAM